MVSFSHSFRKDKGQWESSLMHKKEEDSWVLIRSRTVKTKTVILKFRQSPSFFPPVLTIDSCVLKCLSLRKVLFY